MDQAFLIHDRRPDALFLISFTHIFSLLCMYIYTFLGPIIHLRFSSVNELRHIALSFYAIRFIFQIIPFFTILW